MLGLCTKFYTVIFVRWSSGNMFVSETGGQRFKSLAGEIGHSVDTARHRCEISFKGAVLPGPNDADMGPAYPLHVSAYTYCEYNKRCDLIGKS